MENADNLHTVFHWKIENHVTADSEAYHSRSRPIRGIEARSGKREMIERTYLSAASGSSLAM